MQRPIIVSIISILVITGSILEIIAGGFLFIVHFVGTCSSSLSICSSINPVTLILGIFFLIFGLIGIFLGRGLWKGKNWARITYIIVGTLGLLSSIILIITNPTLTSIITGIISMILPVFIISYLLLSRKVKSYF